MNSFDALLNEACDSDFSIDLDPDRLPAYIPLSNDALFHLPFLAVVILVISKGRRKIKTSDIGQNLGEAIERTIPGFKGSAQMLSWSSTLRNRTANALTFLDQANFILVTSDEREIILTKEGKKFITSVLDDASMLSTCLRALARHYSDIRRELQIKLL